jgi:LysM repeat protein
MSEPARSDLPGDDARDATGPAHPRGAAQTTCTAQLEATLGQERRRPWRRGALAVAAPLVVAGLVTAGSPGFTFITVQRGDTLSGIAHRYHTTVSRLIQANDLPGNGDVIYAGSRLKVPTSATSSGGRSRSRTTKRTVNVSYQVRRGDTLIGLAHRYHVTPTTIRRANHLPASGMIRIDQVLRIPVPRTTTTGSSRSTGNSFAGRTYPSATVARAAAHRRALATRRLPSRSGMRSIIAAAARRQGVSASLALAVSYQESGFNPAVVSVADAIGAMQVVPSTGSWASSIIGRRLDLLNPYDNATAGVVLLRVLLATASTTEQAVAGYYQGLASVRKHGMFADTKQYVANVLALRRTFA